MKEPANRQEVSMGIGNVIKGRVGKKQEYKPPPPASKAEVEELLAGLNPEQREAVLHHEGPMLVAAVAGAGKTRVITHRIAYLVKARGVNPSKILAVTFSKKGADEMNERLVGLIGETPARVGTFHSFALQVLRSEREEYREWKIDATDRYRFCVKDACGYKKLNWKSADITLVCHFISLCKSDLARPGDSRAMEIAMAFGDEYGHRRANPSMLLAAYEEAEKIRRDRQLLTFDDFIIEVVELLSQDKRTLARWASRYDFVLQDEAQDQNRAQLELGELLALKHRNYMLVGDPAQTIYTWRGAMPEMLLNFESRWDAKVVTMGRNYRCGKDIITAANKVLDAMDPKTRLDFHMIAERDADGDIRTTLHADHDDEAESIVTRIQELLEDGHEPRDIACLYRVNAQSRAPEEALISARLPYRIIGSVSFYERKEIKNLLAYLRLADGRGGLDDMARCINTPFRYLGRVFVDHVREAAKDARRRAKKAGGRVSWPGIISRVCSEQRVQRRQEGAAEEWAELIDECYDRIRTAKLAGPEDIEAFNAGKPARVLENIIMDTGFISHLIRDEGQETTENNRVSNVREMIRAAERFTTVSELLDYVDTTLKASREARKSGETPNKITLCTVHRAKGMEWPAVFLCGANEGILPHARCEDEEEERRLFYVAITRAKNHLHVSCVRHAVIAGKVRALPPTHYIDEAALELVVVEREPVDDEAGPAPANVVSLADERNRRIHGDVVTD